MESFGSRDRQHNVLEKLKQNDQVFRQTMEDIFQKYSNLGDEGPDVCLETMTFRTPRGVVSICSEKAEQELQRLRNHVKAEQSLRVLSSSKDEQMDVTQGTENDLDSSVQVENLNESLWNGTVTSQPSANSVIGSRSSLSWEMSQPEEDDEELERTLNSHSTTLLDVYPSMLNQIGEVYRRQHVTETAGAVLRRYRRQRWESSQAQQRNHFRSNRINRTLIRTRESSFAVQNLSHDDMTSSHKDLYSYEGPVASRSREPSPIDIIKSSSLAAVRSNQELSPLMARRNLSLASIRSNQKFSPSKTIQNSSLAPSSSNQDLSPLMARRNSSLASIRSNQELSPLMAKRNASLAAIRSSQELSPLKTIQNSSLAPSSSNQDLSPLMARRKLSLASIRSNQELSPLMAKRNPSLAAIGSSQELSPLKTIQNSSLAPSISNEELLPLMAKRNSSLAAIRSSHKLSPVKTVQNPSIAFVGSSQEHSPLKAIRNSHASSSSNQALSPMKNISIASSACIYSPRRADGENRPVTESRSHWTNPGMHSNSGPQHQPVRVLDLSTPPPAYDADLDMVPESNGVFASAVSSPVRLMCNSPLKGARNVSLTGQVLPSPSRHHPSQFVQHFSSALAERRDRFRDHLHSPTASPRKALADDPPSYSRSPLKPRVFSPEQEEQTSVYCPKQTVHGNDAAALEMVNRSPYQSRWGASFSPRCSPRLFNQMNLPKVEVLRHGTKLPKRQRSSSESQSTSSSESQMSSKQIDDKFKSLYHYFICQGNPFSCPTASCHLCERQLLAGVRTPPTVFSDVSALALTPVRRRVMKRRRPSDVDEHLRLKRFRESCSLKQQQQQQQLSKYTNVAAANQSEEKDTRKRALLLQCPSPGFLRPSGSHRKSSGSNPGSQSYSHSPSWRDTSGCVGETEAKSPMRMWNQSGVSVLPSVSRRRLLYGPPQ